MAVSRTASRGAHFAVPIGNRPGICGIAGKRCVAQQPGRGAPANLGGAARGIEFAAFCCVDHHVWRSRPRAVRAGEALSLPFSLSLSPSQTACKSTVAPAACASAAGCKIGASGLCTRCPLPQCARLAACRGATRLVSFLCAGVSCAGKKNLQRFDFFKIPCVRRKATR